MMQWAQETKRRSWRALTERIPNARNRKNETRLRVGNSTIRYNTACIVAPRTLEMVVVYLYVVARAPTEQFLITCNNVCICRFSKAVLMLCIHVDLHCRGKRAHTGDRRGNVILRVRSM